MPLHILPIDDLLSSKKIPVSAKGENFSSEVLAFSPIWSKFKSTEAVIFQCLLHLFQSGKTPLHYAAERSRDQSCKVLLEAGASVDIQDKVSLPIGYVKVHDHFFTFWIEMFAFKFPTLKKFSHKQISLMLTQIHFVGRIFPYCTSTTSSLSLYLFENCGNSRFGESESLHKNVASDSPT